VSPLTERHPDAGSGMIDLGTLGGNYSHVNAINEAGQVTGFASTASGLPHAVAWMRVVSPP
jgi:uncharacterized membrane protein